MTQRTDWGAWSTKTTEIKTMKYIPAEKLIAEIERYEDTAIDAYNPLGEEADYWHGKVVACEDLKNLIDSLQQEQPEVDLKKEVKSYIKDNFTITDEVAQIPEEDRRYSMWEDDMVAFARHFWNKGYNARKEK